MGCEGPATRLPSCLRSVALSSKTSFVPLKYVSLPFLPIPLHSNPPTKNLSSRPHFSSKNEGLSCDTEWMTDKPQEDDQVGQIQDFRAFHRKLTPDNESRETELSSARDDVTFLELVLIEDNVHSFHSSTPKQHTQLATSSTHQFSLNRRVTRREFHQSHKFTKHSFNQKCAVSIPLHELTIRILGVWLTGLVPRIASTPPLTLHTTATTLWNQLRDLN